MPTSPFHPPSWRLRTHAALVVSLLVLTALGTTGATAQSATPMTVGAVGDAYGIAIDLEVPLLGVPLLDVPPTPQVRVSLPDPDGVEERADSIIHTDVLGPELAAIASAGVVNVAATAALGAESVASAEASVDDVDLLPVAPFLDGTITVDQIVARSTTGCTAQTAEEAAEGSTFTDLRIAGQLIPLDVPVNSTFTVPGVANVTVKETFPDTDGLGWTVRGLRVEVLDPLTQLVSAEIIIAEAHSSVACDGLSVAQPDPTTDLIAGKTADVSTADHGDQVTYTITVQSREETCTLTSVSDVLPAGTSVVAVGGGFEGATTSVADGVLLITVDADVSPDAPFEGTVTLLIEDDAPGVVFNEAAVASAECGTARSGLTAPVQIGGDDSSSEVPTIIAGADDVTTVIEVSNAAFDSAPAAVLARDDDFPDALAASALAVEVGGPILLTDTGALDSEVAAELDRLGVTTVYLAGGEAALSADVADALTDAGHTVRRLAGETRFQTAVRIAEEVVALGGDVDQMVLARADDFPDAMSSANVATWGRAPILLSSVDALHPDSAATLQTLLTAGQTVTVAGGHAALDESVEEAVTDLGFVVDRIGGLERYATSVGFVTAARDLGAGVESLWIASGQQYQSALAASVAAHADGGTLLLVAPTDLADSPATATYLSGHAGQIDRAYLVGAAGTIAEAVAQQIADAIAAS